MGEMRSINLSGRHHLKELGIDGRLTFKWIIMWLIFMWLRMGTTFGLL
jgi:hypothetical protein